MNQRIEEMKNINLEEREQLIHSGVCPDCGCNLVHASGCLACQLCGFTPCEE